MKYIGIRGAGEGCHPSESYQRAVTARRRAAAFDGFAQPGTNDVAPCATSCRECMQRMEQALAGSHGPLSASRAPAFSGQVSDGSHAAPPPASACSAQSARAAPHARFASRQSIYARHPRSAACPEHQQRGSGTTKGQPCMMMHPWIGRDCRWRVAGARCGGGRDACAVATKGNGPRPGSAAQLEARRPENSPSISWRRTRHHASGVQGANM